MIIQLKLSRVLSYGVFLLCCTKVVLTFEFLAEILKCDHSNESYQAVLSSSAVYYAVQGCSDF